MSTFEEWWDREGYLLGVQFRSTARNVFNAGLAARAAVPESPTSGPEAVLLGEIRRYLSKADDAAAVLMRARLLRAGQLEESMAGAVPGDAGMPEVPPRPVAVCLRCKLLRQPHVSGLACDPAPPVTGGTK